LEDHIFSLRLEDIGKSNKSTFGKKKKKGLKNPSKKATLARGKRRQAIRTTKLGSIGIFKGLLENIT